MNLRGWYNKMKVWIGLVIFVLLITQALAIGTYQETASVARIVGESPAEMIKQMQRDSIDIKEATYYSYDSEAYENFYTEPILVKQFGYDKVKKPLFNWNFDMFEQALGDMEKNELLIVGSDGGINPLRMGPTSYPAIKPVDVRDWQDDFEEKNPLFLLDSPYGGAYLPNEDSFVSRLVRDSTIIAPSSFNTEQFVHSTICMLYDDKTVGQLFKDARNFHYNGGSTSSSQNYIGLILQSYSLYGNPRQKITMPEYNMAAIKSYCKNFLQNIAEGIEFIGYEGNYSKFRKHLVFTIDNYNLVAEGNFTIINASNTFQILDAGELVLPKAVRTT